MKRSRVSMWIVFAVLWSLGPLTSPGFAQDDDKPQYKGRTIAQTMHWMGAEWLLRETREKEERVSVLMEALGVEAGQTVCDLGCGNGYHALRLAKRVGASGKVLAVDIQQPMLDMLEKRSDEAGLGNIQTILGDTADPKIPDGSCDLILLVDVYHEFSDPEAMLAMMRKALKPDGRIALVEFRSEDPEVPIKKLHKMSKAQILKEYLPAGYRLVEQFDDLPWQHLMFFTRDDAPSTPEKDWIQLFNGKDLKDWKIKFAGHDLGDNYKDTFRVEDGVLKVDYSKYDSFDAKFGHIFHKDSFSHYRLRVEYRFVGKQVPGGPGWAFRNNGLMLHCQSPESIEKGQDFPASIEVQLLGGPGGDSKRSTANLCTPSTNVVMGGKLLTRHCLDSTSETYHGDQWVTVEIEVRGNEIIRHIIDGKTVLEYTEPQLDERDGYAKKLMAAGARKMLSEGYISLQAESHPTEFRKIELQKLDPR
ncbi:MAG: family 16 glycoside hydrolase [Planctomycetota bacterium]|nr:family 16 glycoside hydrolase [Planctomycetota bacterium]